MTERSLQSISPERTENAADLYSIHPDGITGMIFAMEGIKNAVVLLNGPMGCRFYHSTTS